MKASGHERGIALVIVLWVGLLVAAIAGAFIVSTRTSAKLSRNFLDTAEARALADGGVHFAVFELLRPNADAQWRRDGRLYQRDVPGGKLSIAIEDEAGKIDLNRASGELLEGLFLSAGVDSDRAGAFVDAIEKIRSGRELGGQMFPSAGAGSAGAVPPNNVGTGRGRLVGGRAGMAFLSVDSLGQVPGMTAELQAKLRPALTVFGNNKLDFTDSPREALLAIPGVSADAVDTFLQGRTGDDVNVPLNEFMVEGQARDYWRKGESNFVTVKVQAQSQNGAKFTRIAIVELTRRSKEPFIVKEWKEGDAQSMPLPPPPESETVPGGTT